MIKKLKLPLSKLIVNENNPRYIREGEFEELYQSILEFPEMSEAKEIVVNQDYIIIGGTMRYQAMQKAGWKEANVVIVDWTPEKQAEFVIKDNTHKGEWDYGKLAQKWTFEEAGNWGIDTGRWQDISPVAGTTVQSTDTRGQVITCPYCGHENERI